MQQVFIRKGKAIVADVPVPSVEPGQILVRVRASCLSIGTEMSGIRSSAAPMWKRALKQPENVAKVLRVAASQGVGRAREMVEEKRNTVHPTGYSAVGVVVEVGAGIEDITPGDRVACAGGRYAYHAEMIRVPRNLCTPLPDNLDWESASTITLGAIALQGVRRAQPTLGESFVVIGLGALGQLTAQLLRINGCRVIGTDLDRDRITRAISLGIEAGVHPEDGDDTEQVARLTDGLGADGVIITAATTSDSVISSAFRMCRKKGRVVLVGDVGLHLNRADFYTKEIDFFISTSYGPGRYDRHYEEQGLDYPAAYVRWTENRNMAEYLRLLAEKRLQVASLITAQYPISQAPVAYASLMSDSGNPMMVILTYPDGNVQDMTSSRTIHVRPSASPATGSIRIAVLGAGSFARSVHMPNLKHLKDRFTLQAVVTRSGHNATAVAKQFGAVYASSDYEAVLADPDIDAVIIATRHHLHGQMALKALQAGKHVLVEKPLALTVTELEALNKFITAADESPVHILMTGYNRRFSPYACCLSKLLQDRSGPFILNYRMNAGYIPMDHWVHSSEGGGRNIGEACHIYDLFTYLTGAEAKEVAIQPIVPRSHYYSRTDNFITVLRFADGSVASLTYTSLGSKEYPKETADLYIDGKVAILEDYKRLDFFGIREKSFRTTVQEKGHKEELIAFADAICSGKWPIPWWQQMQASQIAFAVESGLRA